MLKRLFWNMLTGTLIPWIGVFLDKLIVTHMVKIAPLFMETKGLLRSITFIFRLMHLIVQNS